MIFELLAFILFTINLLQSAFCLDIISTIAGSSTSGSYSGDNGQAVMATLFTPKGVSLDSSGNIYIADFSNQRIRKVSLATGIITTIAGSGTSGTYSGDNGQATAASLNYPSGVSLDSSGNVYIADYNNNRIRKVAVSTTIITTVAGNGAFAYGGDNGQATSASLYLPAQVSLDSSGNLYIADTYNNRVRKVTTSTGIITTIAGTGTSNFSGDNGQATAATLNKPAGVTVDSTGNVYVSDNNNNRIRKVTVLGIISTIVGSSTSASYTGDGGPATAATLGYPHAVALDSSGNLYIAEAGNCCIRKVTVATGIISTIAGTGSGGYSGDNGEATAAALNAPIGVSLDSSGNVYIGDSSNNRIRKVTDVTNAPSMSPTLTPPSTAPSTATPSISPSQYPSTATPSTSPSQYPSTATPSTSPSQYPSTATPSISPSQYPSTATPSISPSQYPSTATPSISPSQYPSTATPSISPSQYPSTATPSISPSQYPSTATPSTNYPSLNPNTVFIISTIAGSSTSTGYSGDNSDATSATFNNPAGICLDASGNMYIADTYNNRVRKVTIATGIITSIAGSGGTGSTSGSYSGDNGQATAATLNVPFGVGLDLIGNVYVADWKNQRVRKVTISTGVITTVAGNGTSSYSGDNGQATAATLRYPTGIALDSLGNIYIADCDNFRIRKVTVSTGIITTIAGTGVYSYSGDYGDATSATFLFPFRVALDSLGNVYIADSGNNRIRKVTVSTGIITTIAGSSTSTGYSGDGGQATAAQMYYPHGLVLDTSGNVYITDSNNNRVRKVTISTGIITTIAGNGTNGYTGDNDEATSAQLNYPNAIALDISGNLFIADTYNNRIRKVAVFTTTTVSPSASPTSTPTSSPTNRDNVAANLLIVPLDDKVAKAKIKYYLGAFVGYFLAIYICLYLYSFLRYGNDTATKLYDISYKSEAYIKYSAATSSSNISILFDLYVKNSLVQSNMKLQDKLMVVKQNSKAKYVDTTDEESKYSKGYREYVHQQRTLLGCSSFLYPEGYVLKVPCTSREIFFPPGRVEDILLYICHNHPLFSCFYFMDGSKLGAHGTRILYISKDIVVFVLYQFTNMLLQHLMLDGRGLGTFINLFIITPSALSVGLLLKYLYTCPFTETVEFQRKYAKYQSTVLFLGRLAIVPIMLIMFGSLIIACLFSSNRDVPLILVNYFIYVQFHGIVLVMVKTILLFIDGYYYQLSLFGLFDFVCVGRLFKERILAEQLELNVDYAYRIHTYIFGLIKIQVILNREDAIKAKWITEDGGYDKEIKGNDESFALQINPLVKGLRGSATISMDGIYGTSNNEDEEVDERIKSSSNSSSDAIVENPINSLASTGERDNYHTTTTIHHNNSLNLQQSEINRNNRTAEVSVLDDEAALYLEYQSLQYNQDDTMYDTYDTEAVMSFEEWKTRRRQFKEGTRGSFVKAFQVFEDREQVARDNLEQSASMKNTIHLHIVKFKNVLATKSASKL